MTFESKSNKIKFIYILFDNLSKFTYLSIVILHIHTYILL